MLNRFIAILVGLTFLSAAVKPTDSIEFASQVQIHKEHGLINRDTFEVPGDSHLKLMPSIIAAMRKGGVAKIYIADIHQLPFFADYPMLLGYTDIGEKTGTQIFVDIDQSINTIFSTLTHEFGHHIEPPRVRKLGYGRQVWAETFSYLVCKRLGLDTFEASAAYLSQPKIYEFMWVTQYFSHELDEAVEKFLKDVQS